MRPATNRIFSRAGRCLLVQAIALNHQLSTLASVLALRYPDLLLDLSCSEQPGEALQEGADIAVQLRPFGHPDLVVRRIGRIALGLYASLDYLRRRGEPSCDSGCAGHDLLAILESCHSPGEAEWIGANAGAARLVMRTNSRETQFRACVLGGGLALLPCFRADHDPHLQRIGTLTPAPVTEIWLAVQRESRAVPRVRAVLDAVAEAFRCCTDGADAPAQEVQRALA